MVVAGDVHGRSGAHPVEDAVARRADRLARGADQGWREGRESADGGEEVGIPVEGEGSARGWEREGPAATREGVVGREPP